MGLRDGATDGEVVRAVLAGDVERFAVLVCRYRDRYARYATRMLGSGDAAEDAVQDALVRAFDHLADCREPDKFAPAVAPCESGVAARRNSGSAESGTATPQTCPARGSPPDDRTPAPERLAPRPPRRRPSPTSGWRSARSDHGSGTRAPRIVPRRPPRPHARSRRPSPRPASPS